MQRILERELRNIGLELGAIWVEQKPLGPIIFSIKWGLEA